ncbi:MAG: metal ABC transporter substrate-binding protein [Planctomycetota bacterium]
MNRVFLLAASCVLSLGLVSAALAKPLKVCVSSTDVKTIVEAVGGDAVSVTGFVKGPDDPHVVQPTRRMIEALARADLLVIVGNALEEAWLPGMVTQAGRAELGAGGKRHLDLSANLRTIVGPEGRGVPGSFHPEDNPHFLVDAVEGVKAAAAVADKLSEVAPEQTDQFEQRYRTFAKAVMVEMLGEAIASKHPAEDFEELAIAIERGKLAEHLAAHGGGDVALGGQLAVFEPFRDTPLVGDHDMWPYFARRYGVRVLGYLEPEPGVPPTAPHLQDVIGEMKARDVGAILTVAYFDPRHARFVADATGAVIAPMAHNPESRPGTESYLDMIRYNAQTLYEVLEKSRAGEAAAP